MGHDKETLSSVAADPERKTVQQSSGNSLDTVSLAALKRNLALNPSDHAAHHHYAAALAEAGRQNDGANHYAHASDTRQDDPWLAKMAGVWLNNLGRHQEAIHYLTRATALNPNDGENYHQLAYAAERSGQVDKAVVMAVRSFRLDPQNSARALYAVHILLILGRRKDAIQVLRSAINTIMDPGPTLHRTLSGLIAQEGEFSLALDEINRALALDANNNEYHVHRSSLLFELGRYDEAVEALDKAIDSDPNNAALVRHKVSILLEAGNISQAMAATAHLLQSSPDNKDYADCMRHILTLGEDGAELYTDVAERKRNAHPRERQPYVTTLSDAAMLQIRVIWALLLREVRTRFGESRFGYLWVLMELIIHIGFLAVVFQFTMHGKPPIGDSFFFFYFTGLIPYLLFTHTVSHVSYAILQNQPLLQLPMVTNIDAILARGILELITEVLVMLLFIGGFIFFDVEAIPHNLGAAAGSIFAAWLCGLGIGVINAVINVYSHAYHHVFSAVTRLLYFCSGIFYVPALMPEGVRDLFTWNPLFHCVDWFRTSFFYTYEPRWLDPSYPIIFGFVTLALGLSLEAALRKSLRQLQ